MTAPRFITNPDWLVGRRILSVTRKYNNRSVLVFQTEDGTVELATRDFLINPGQGHEARRKRANCWECLLDPTYSRNGHFYSLPVEVRPRWSAQLGRRLMQARLWRCQRVDRRTHHWRHKSVIVFEGRCECISQKVMAEHFGVSQGQYSRIEQGKSEPRSVCLTLLYKIFGDLSYWILTGTELKREINLANKNKDKDKDKDRRS